MLSLKNSFIFLILGIFLISCVSAFEWDNVYTYDKFTDEVTIKNAFGFGDDIAQLNLIWGDTKVPEGIDIHVGTFGLIFFENTTDEVFDEMDLSNLKNGQTMTRGKQYKVKIVKNQEEVPIYETQCQNDLNNYNESENGTIVYEQICKEVQNGIEYKDIVEWMPIVNPHFNFENNVYYEIGIFVDVEVGDYGDWKPDLLGVLIKEYSTWTQSLNVRIIDYNKFDEQDITGSGIIIDEVNLNNGTNNGASNSTGKIETAYDYDGSNDYITLGTGIQPTTEVSVNAWIYRDTTGDEFIIGKWAWDAPLINGRSFAMQIYTSNKLRFYISSDGTDPGSAYAISTTNVPDNEWAMVTGTFDGSNIKVYINGVLNGTQAKSSGISLESSTPTAWGVQNLGGTLTYSHFEGRIDEGGIWNRSLSSTEITQLYNNGIGISYVSGPTINILFPENITYNDTVTQLNYTNSSNAVQCWFTTDGGVTNSSPIICGTNFTTTSQSGSNTWTIYANDSLGVEGSDTVTFFVNKTVETTLINPAQGSNTTNQQVNFSFISTPINTNLTNATLYLWNETDGSLILTNFTSLSGTSQINTNLTNTLEEGNYKWNAETCGIDVNCNFASSNYSFIVHLTAPTVNVTAPKGFYNRTANIEETLVYNISETVENLTEHLDQCWYAYNGTNTSLNCTGTSTNFTYAEGQNNITVYVNDTFGLVANDITTWSYLFEKVNLTYDTSIYEGTLDVFEVEVILGGGNTISQAIFEYNNTNYTATIDFSGGEYMITASIPAPTVANDTNFSLGFYLVISGTTYLLNSQTQLVLNTNFKECGVGEDLLLNISLKDEDDKTILVGDIELDAQLIGKLTGEIVESISLSFTSVSYAEICLTPDSSFNNYYLDAKIRYESTDYAAEFYNIQEADISDYPNDLVLFDLNLNSSTEFLLRYQGQTLTKVEGAIIQLQRYYISLGASETVEAPLTSISGTAIVHINLNTNEYSATVVKDGVILDIFTGVVFDCENELSGQCTQNLYADVTPYNTIDSATLTDFYYAISDTGDKLVTTFSIPSGSTKPVNIVMTQRDQFGETTSCNQTVTTSSGSLECTYNKTIGDSYLFLEINKDGELQAQKEYFVPEANGTDWDGLNWLFLFGFLISLSLMAISSPEWIIGNAIITFIIGGALWLANGINIVAGLGLLLWLLVSAIILILELAKQEDR